MTREELYQAAQELARVTIEHAPSGTYDKLKEHAEQNWSIDINGMIYLAFEHAFGVGR
jgi:plasmid maintenance system killer protein